MKINEKPQVFHDFRGLAALRRAHETMQKVIKNDEKSIQKTSKIYEKTMLKRGSPRGPLFLALGLTFGLQNGAKMAPKWSQKCDPKRDRTNTPKRGKT